MVEKECTTSRGGFLSFMYATVVFISLGSFLFANAPVPTDAPEAGEYSDDIEALIVDIADSYGMGDEVQGLLDGLGSLADDTPLRK